MKQELIAAVLATLALSAPAMAQSYQPQSYPPQGYEPQSYEVGVLRPREIMGMLRSTGFEPLDRPVRRGPNYVLRAIDGNDREVTLVINGRNGRILSATPLRTASRMPPGAPSGVTMGEWQRMPPGYTPPPGTVPQPGYSPGAPTADDEYDDAPQAPVQGALPRTGSNPPRGYNGGQPDDEADAQPQSDPQVIPADPQGGPLPPPPERFPQRAAPASPPKPVKRAAAAPPKTAPLPKPKPNAPAAAPSTSTPPAAATKEWPNSSAPNSSEPKSPAPAKVPAPEETPI